MGGLEDSMRKFLASTEARIVKLEQTIVKFSEGGKDVSLFVRILEAEKRSERSIRDMLENPGRYCAFCGEKVPQHTTGSPLPGMWGPTVFICRKCIATCVTVMAEDPEWRDEQLTILAKLRAQNSD